MTSTKTTNRRTRRRQRGTVSLEAALVMPLIMIVIVGGVHFGMVLMARHKLSDAASYAARAAVVRNSTDPSSTQPAAIRASIVNRIGAGACADVTVTAKEVIDQSVRRLDVTATCTLNPTIGGNLLGAIGPNQVSVVLSVPL